MTVYDLRNPNPSEAQQSAEMYMYILEEALMQKNDGLRIAIQKYSPLYHHRKERIANFTVQDISLGDDVVTFIS